MARKQKEKCGYSASASKVFIKGASKRKNEGKDDPRHKMGLVTPIGDKQSKQLSPPSHGVGKGLMMGRGPAAQGAIHHFLMQKEYAFEMVDSIIKETNLDPCADQTTEDLGVLGLFDMSRVCLPYVLICYLSILLLTGVLILGVGAYVGSSRKVHCLRGVRAI